MEIEEEFPTFSPPTNIKKVDLDKLLRDFIALPSSQGGGRQRSAQWKKLMDTTFGGSEMSALMGINPYLSYGKVLRAKLGLEKWDGGSIACWWGSMFEDVVARVVEIDCGTTVLGDEICIQRIPGHRNSPDGYCIVKIYTDEGGQFRIWTPNSEHDPEFNIIVLLEIKSPYRRSPEGKVVRQYRPQIWSGLAVSPVAHMGLFIDARFRKCSIEDLGPSLAYDSYYHNDRSPPTEPPFAWGLTAIYAPRMDASRAVRLGTGADTESTNAECVGGGLDASMEGWEIASKYFGYGVDPDQMEIVDFGDCGRDRNSKLFDMMMGLVDRKKFLVRHSDPCLIDGRGEDLNSGLSISDAIDTFQRNAQDEYVLLGVLPWKLFEIDYVSEMRQPGFFEEIKRMVGDAQAIVASARASEDPEGRLQDQISARALQRRAMHRSPRGTSPVGEKDLQDLFDAMASSPQSCLVQQFDDALAQTVDVLAQTVDVLAQTVDVLAQTVDDSVQDLFDAIEEMEKSVVDDSAQDLFDAIEKGDKA